MRTFTCKGCILPKVYGLLFYLQTGIVCHNYIDSLSPVNVLLLIESSGDSIPIPCLHVLVYTYSKPVNSEHKSSTKHMPGVKTDKSF